MLYGDDLAELQGQLEDAQQALRDAPEAVDNQDELLALEAEASAQVRGMSLSMAVVFFSQCARSAQPTTACEGLCGLEGGGGLGVGCSS